MRVGVYIDGFNLYFGGSAIVGAAVPGWKWLDMRAVFGALAHVHWPTTTVIEPVVYCTARLNARVDPTGYKRQETYLRALIRAASVDRIEYGKFFEKVKTRPVALADRKGRPVVVKARHPVVVKDAGGSDVPDAVFMVTVADREEKGSDVNVACHLLIDTLLDKVDAAIVVSNDSDLALAVSQARERIPVGIVNPTRRPTAGSLKSRPPSCPPEQWEYQLTAADLIAHQLPDPCAGIIKPPTW